MSSYLLNFGRTLLELDLPEDYHVEKIEPVSIQGVSNPLEAVFNALLDDPILDRFSKARTVAIAINDKTRPVPYSKILPPLLQKINQMGIALENVNLLVATGTHKPINVQEIQRALPEECVNCSIYSHDSDDTSNLVDIGFTTRKTPIFVNKRFFESDLRIVTGNIEPHHFMGFSGGAKTASIGLTGRETINRNHRMLLDPACCAGTFGTNPMRMDVEEIGRKIGIHYALNVILNSQKEITHVISGNPEKVMEKGIELCRQFTQVPVKGKFDLVIASVGGAPKDINLYQSQKALTHAEMITRDGGVVILIAACPEGPGNEKFENFMKGIDSPQEALQKFKNIEFEIGPHKAYQIARQALRIHIILISEMAPDLVRRCMLIPAEDLNKAFTTALKILPANPRIALLPYATNTLPFIVEK